MTLSPESILEDARHLAPEITKMRHELHRLPEVGLDLPKTQERVLASLDGLGLELTLGSELTSVTGVLRSTHPEVASLPLAERPVVLLRGDMDGLPVTEQTGVDFSSQTGNTMHACGHDLHTSMLAASATLLAERRHELRGDVVFMFQPGEEGYDGAGHMIQEGVLDAAGKRADSAFGLHVLSAIGEAGQFSSRPGTAMSASDALTVTVHGRGGHGSSPYAANDPVVAAAEMVQALQTLVTRRFNIFDPVVISVGLLRAGTARNIIPETAHFEATIRSFSRDAHDVLREDVPRLIRSIANAYGLEAVVEYRSEYPVTVNDAASEAFVAHAATEMFGAGGYAQMADPLAGSEDFSRVLAEVPGAFVFLSALAPDEDPATAEFNHSPFAIFDDSVLPRGAALYTHLATAKLAELARG